MAFLSMYGITNVLIKVDNEVPNIDGSAKDLCDLIAQAGIEEQPAFTRVAVIRQKLGVGKEERHEKDLYGKAGGGYFHSHIIMYDGKVINTKLRYPDEFVRHKILDLIGDLYLLGFSIRGRITANMTSHGYNQALVERLYQAIDISSR